MDTKQIYNLMHTIHLADKCVTECYNAHYDAETRKKADFFLEKYLRERNILDGLRIAAESLGYIVYILNEEIIFVNAYERITYKRGDK